MTVRDLGSSGGLCAERTRLTFVLLMWLAASLTVMALFLVLGRTLEDLPVPLRALVISGVLTVTLSQLAIPLIGRLLAGGPG